MFITKKIFDIVITWRNFELTDPIIILSMFLLSFMFVIVYANGLYQ